MNQTQIQAAETAARSISPSLTRCDWNESERCLVYQFTSGKDAEQFKLSRETQGSRFRMVVKIYHSALASVSEYRPN
jgi:hypothetical protein